MPMPGNPARLELAKEPQPGLRASGEWTLPQAAALDARLARGDVRQGLALDASGIERLDSAGAFLLRRLACDCGLQPEAPLASLPPAWHPLYERVLAAVGPAGPLHVSEGGLHALLARIGASVEGIWHQTRQLLGFLGLSLLTLGRCLLRPARLRLTATVHHIEQVGLDALPLVALLSFLIGAVVAFLGATVLRDFGAELWVVELVSFAFMREFGVLLTAILLAGRTASAFTAQIGAMKAREEIDAIRTLGLDPIELLVIPRLLALLVALPLLSFVALLAGIGGGMAVCAASLGITPDLFVSRLEEYIELRHFLTGLSKAPLFAAVIALIGCLEGFKVSGSAQSVGERTTSSVVQAIFVVILIDALAAIFFMEMGW